MNRIVLHQIHAVGNQFVIKKLPTRLLYVKYKKNSAGVQSISYIERFSRLDIKKSIHNLMKNQRRSYGVYHDCNGLSLLKTRTSTLCKYKNQRRNISNNNTENFWKEYGKNFCRVTDSKITALYIDGIFDAFDGDHDPLENLKSILYPEKLNELSGNDAENDPLYQLSNAKSVKDLLNSYSNINESELSVHHAAQAISTLRYLQKLSSMAINYFNENEHRIAQIEFNRLLMNEPVFKSILTCLKSLHSDLNINIMAYIFQCLRRLEQPLESPIMTCLEVHIRKNFSDIDSEALSFFSTGLSGRKHTSSFYGSPLRRLMSLAPAVHHINTFINEMKTAKDVHQISICISMMGALISNESIDKFYQKLNDVITRGEFKFSNHDGSIYGLEVPAAKNVYESNYMQVSALVRVLSLYMTRKDWHLTRVDTVRSVLYLLKGRLHLLRPDQLVITSRVLFDLGEPATMMYEIDNHMRKLFEMQTASHIEDNEIYYMRENETTTTESSKVEASNPSQEVTHDVNVTLRSYIPKIDFLHSMITSRLGKVDENIARHLVIEILEGQTFPAFISQIFGILRHSSLGNDKKIVKEYLHRSFEICSHDMLELCRLATRYGSFNSPTIGIIRDPDFEQNIITLFTNDILRNPYPVEFSAQLGFLLSYSDSIDPEVLERFHFMLPQLRPFHLFNIARGLETRFETIPRSFTAEYKRKNNASVRHLGPIKRSLTNSPELSSSEKYFTHNEKLKKIYNEVDVALSKQSLVHFTRFAEKKYQSENIDESMNQPSIDDNGYMYPAADFPDVYHIFRNFICRRAYLDKEGFNTMVEYMVKYLERTQLTSTVIRQAAGSLCTLRPQHDLSTIVDRMVTYLLNNRMHVHTTTLLRPMQLIYSSNDNISDSPKGQAFLELCSTCLQRDFDAILCSHVISMASQMAAKGKLDRNLTIKIFSVEFLDKIDSEIEQLATSENMTPRLLWYPRTLRMSLMNLNRLVCICFPEYNVPWFHEKYCIEHEKFLKGPIVMSPQLSSIKEDVYQTLCKVTGGYRNVRENVFSPYYHYIDFEVWLDTTGLIEDLKGEKSSNNNFLPIGETSAANISVIKKAASSSSLSANISQNVKQESEQGIEKFAVLIHQFDDYILNADTRITGDSYSTVKQLETLGYNVISINPNKWQGMGVSSSEDKLKYLKRLGLSVSDYPQQNVINKDIL